MDSIATNLRRLSGKRGRAVCRISDLELFERAIPSIGNNYETNVKRADQFRKYVDRMNDYPYQRVEAAARRQPDRLHEVVDKRTFTLTPSKVVSRTTTGLRLFLSTMRKGTRSNAAIIDTPSGPVMVDDGATPEVISKIVAAHSTPAARQQAQAATRAAAPKLTADQQEVQRRVAAEKKSNATGLFGQAGADYWRRATQGFLSNFGDELSGAASAATTGVKNAVQKHSLSEIGHEYRLARDTEHQLSSEAEQRTGLGGTAAEIALALANPIGDGVKAFQLAGKAVPLAAKAAAKLESRPGCT
jgi:hypothetical protein